MYRQREVVRQLSLHAFCLKDCKFPLDFWETLLRQTENLCTSILSATKYQCFTEARSFGCVLALQQYDGLATHILIEIAVLQIVIKVMFREFVQLQQVLTISQA